MDFLKVNFIQVYYTYIFSGFCSENIIHIFSVDFALKVLQWSDSEMVRLQLWDIAGRMGKRDKNKGRHFGLTNKLSEKK